MKLQRREKILAAVVGGLALLWAGWFLFFSGGSLSYGRLSARRDQLADEVSKKEGEVRAAAAAAKRLVEWQHRALPSDVTDARANYQTWLRELVDRLQFQKPTVESAGGESRANTFTLMKFRVHGRTNLQKLVEFLYEFYSAGHLHQIRLLDLSAVPNSADLEVNADVEAMSLPGADRKSELTAAQGKSLRLSKPADYSKTIVGRNLFGPFRSPLAPPDAAKSTFVTAILTVDGRGEVWLVDRTTGKDWKLHEGEQFRVGMLEGSVKAVGTRDVTIDLGGRLRRYHYGDSLGGGDEMRGMRPPWSPPPGYDGRPVHKGRRSVKQ
jgi:hypothetical protein